MSRRHRTGPILAFSFAVASLAVITAVPADAQSSKRQTGSPQAGSNGRQAGSGGRVSQPDSFTQDDVALEGYCPVCVIEMKQWVKGSPEHAVEYDGNVYLFPGQEQQDMFARNPQKYAPVLGGDCVVCYVNNGDRVAGSVRNAALSGGRLYLFPNKELRQEFLDNPDKYKGEDVAAGGRCTVCRVEMGKEVAGKPEFSLMHDGLRYLFPGKEQMQMFMENPDKYEVQ